MSSLRSDELLDRMREAGVTVLFGVPQLYSLFYKNVSEKMNRMPFLFKSSLLGLIEILWLIRRFCGINLSRSEMSVLECAIGDPPRVLVV